MGVAGAYCDEQKTEAMMQDAVDKLFEEQLAVWTLAGNNYRALDQVRTKYFEDGDSLYKVQFNPARITSSSAKVDTQSIRARACFLCPHHLPVEQRGIAFKTRYQILVNPFPIFPRHLTIPEMQHVDQRIEGRIDDMLDLAQELDRYVVFYNGPKCGASAPDHFHFQAGNKGLLPVEENARHGISGEVLRYNDAILWYADQTAAPRLLIEATEKADAIHLFETIYGAMTPDEASGEPMMNLLAWYEEGKWFMCIFPRAAHRPACYYAEGEENLLISPGSVDMGGVLITVQEKDYDKIALQTIRQVMEEVSIRPEDFRRLQQQIKENV